MVHTKETGRHSLYERDKDNEGRSSMVNHVRNCFCQADGNLQIDQGSCMHECFNLCYDLPRLTFHVVCRQTSLLLSLFTIITLSFFLRRYHDRLVHLSLLADQILCAPSIYAALILRSVFQPNPGDG